MPVCPRLFVYKFKKRGHGEKIVLDYMLVLDKVHYLGLRTSGTMDHSVNILAHLVKDFLYDRGISACRRQDKASGIERGTFHSLCQGHATAIDKLFRNCRVITFRIFSRKILAENIMARRCQPVAAHTSVVRCLVCSLPVGRKTDNDIAARNVCIVYDIASAHAACHRTIDNNGPNQISDICRLTAGADSIYSKFAQTGKQLLRSIDYRGNHIA